MRNFTLTWSSVALLLLPLAGARTLAAQTSCTGREPVGWLGISRLLCSNCYVAYPGEGRPSLFSVEPRIASVANNSPAAAVLREGDVLVGIDDNLITTHAAGQRLANLKPGEAVWVEVRRNGELLRYRFGNLPSICPSDARMLGSRARPGSLVAGGAVGRFGRADEEVGAVRSRVFTPPLLPRASFGFGIACSRCEGKYGEDGTLTWEFDEFPEIYSVESQSQAYRVGIRRGDVITRIDEADITSAEGGRKFGLVQAGQTVRFTFRRGSTNITRDLVAQARSPAVATARAGQTDNSLREAREMIEQIRRQETREREQIDELRKHEERQMRELADRLMAQQVEQTRRLNELHNELERIERVRAQAVGPALPRVAPRVVADPSVRNRNVIRYSGKLGDTDVEVRGPAGVDVIETRDEIIITTSDSTIRLKRANR